MASNLGFGYAAKPAQQGNLGFNYGAAQIPVFTKIFDSLKVGMKTAMIAMPKVFGVLKNAVSGMLGPIGVFIQILEALGIMEPLNELMQGFIGILGTGFMPVILLLINAITPLIPPFQMLIQALTPLITIVMSFMLPINLINAVMPYLIVGMTYLSNALNTINPLIQAFQTALNAMTLPDWVGLIQSGFAAVGDFFSGIGKWILDKIMEGWNAVTEAWDSFWSG
jgi:hypothetical protein